MTVCSTVIYPNDNPDAKFDKDYYLATHMPLVSKTWGPLGLKSWQITYFDEGLGGAKPTYRVQALLYWDSAEHVKKAVGGETAKIVFGDVPKFTDISPVFTVGSVVGSEDISN